MDILWYSIITMGAESLSNSEGKGIGNKVKRGAFAVLVAVSSVGLGLSQEASASATTQSPEVSSKIPTAEQSFDHDLARLQAAASKINSSDKFADVKVYNDKTIDAKPGVFGKGYTFVGGYGGIIESKDKSTLLTYGYGFTRTPSGSYISRDFGMTLYMGYPIGHPVGQNPPGLSDNQVYSFDLTQINNKLSVSTIGGDPILGSNPTASMVATAISEYTMNIGIALSSASSTEPFSPKQETEINTLVNQAIEVMKDSSLGYVERDTGAHYGVLTGGMFPPENPPKNKI